MFLQQGLLGSNDFWRYVVGVMLVLMGYFLGQIPMTLVMMAKTSSDGGIGTADFAAFEKTMDFSIFGIDKNVGLILMLIMFLFAIVALYFVVKNLHQKSFKRLITPYQNIDFGRIGFGFFLWICILILSEMINYFLAPETYHFQLDWSKFLPLVIISFVFLPIQTTFEELFFRGYIMQGIANYHRSKWVAIAVSSLLFGLMHSMNPEVAKYGLLTMQAYYILAAGFLAVITILDDRLELALGVHAATNIGGALLVTYEGSVIQTDSIFSTAEVKPWLMIMSLFMAAIIFIAICTHKYGWQNIKSLNKNIETPSISVEGNNSHLAS
jgi:uncharacterized protein